MSDPQITLTLTLAVASLAGLAMLILAALNGWRGWLQLKSQQMRLASAPVATPNTGARIEIADLKERIRKLEAIAAGVDL
ncbi:hypothetical protein [Sphingomonas sp. 8AM]|uniref:hypothetical protein n=1 Tax=Sphingomonas sp. 8AM TaxID=2653170 RepID=UPI0012EFB0E7|nr:hypothetical protein [Sphingomonas sp. 8AM]VXC62846.1 conserved hypothetical protein [Sphingomonas sp. 8AM]